MPAMLDDPDAPTIYRVSGEPPYPDPDHPSLPPDVLPRQVTLRDRQTVATIVPFASRHQVPNRLLRYLNDQFNKEILGGDTYPMMDTMPFEKFASYWFQNFAAIMVLGHFDSAEEVFIDSGKDWSKECLGTFYIKPNYPGRSSHVCNAGFIVTDASRGRGVGRLMGESYLDWAPRLGYTYSVFNLVYETNVASCKIWDALGFKRIGRVKGCGRLKSYPDRLIDAIIYGRELDAADANDGDELAVSEERFDRIRFYLKTGKYPASSDRAEKSRLRSAATHYKLLDGDRLMLKDKEVVSDPVRQLDIARQAHAEAHGGINKTTAKIAERYHWSRIKETVSDVVKQCAHCKELAKAPQPFVQRPSRSSPTPSSSAGTTSLATSTGRKPPATHPFREPHAAPEIHTFPVPATHTGPYDLPGFGAPSPISRQRNPMLQDHPQGISPAPPLRLTHSADVSLYQPIDPQIINQPGVVHADHHHHHDPHHHHHQHSIEEPADPFSQFHHHATTTHHGNAADADEADVDTFADLLNTGDGDGELVVSVGGHTPMTPADRSSSDQHGEAAAAATAAHALLARPSADTKTRGQSPSGRATIAQKQQQQQEEGTAAVDRDMEMLMEPQEDDEHEQAAVVVDGASRSTHGADDGMDVDDEAVATLAVVGKHATARLGGGAGGAASAGEPG